MLEFLFSSDPTMMQHGGQDGHLNYDNYMGKWPQLQCIFEPRHEETNDVVSEQAGHKTSYTNTEDEQKLETPDLGSTGTVLSAWRKQRR